MNFLNLLAEANPNAKVGKKTADELQKEATIGKPAFKAVESPDVAQGTNNNSNAIVGAIITNPPTNHALRPVVVDEGYDAYENDDDDAVPSVPPKRTNTAAPVVLSPVPNSVIASDQHCSTNGKKCLAEEEYISTKNSKRKTSHHNDDAKANTATPPSELTAPELYNGYHEAQGGNPGRPRKKARGARRNQLSAATPNAGARQAGLSTIVKVSEHAANTTQAASISLSSGTGRHPAMVVNVVTLKSKTETTRDHTNHGTATSGKITNAAPEYTEPITHDALPVRDVEKKTIFVDRTEPYGITPAARYVPSPLSHPLTPSDISTDMSSDNSSDDSTVIYYDGD